MLLNGGGGGGYGCVVEAVEVGWRWVDAAFGPATALASAPFGGGCRWYTVTLQASPALC
jgi:hypothetical protein